MEYWNDLLRRSSFGYEGWNGIMGFYFILLQNITIHEINQSWNEKISDKLHYEVENELLKLIESLQRK